MEKTYRVAFVAEVLIDVVSDDSASEDIVRAEAIALMDGLLDAEDGLKTLRKHGMRVYITREGCHRDTDGRSGEVNVVDVR